MHLRHVGYEFVGFQAARPFTLLTRLSSCRQDAVFEVAGNFGPIVHEYHGYFATHFGDLLKATNLVPVHGVLLP